MFQLRVALGTRVLWGAPHGHERAPLNQLDMRGVHSDRTTWDARAARVADRAGWG